MESLSPRSGASFNHVMILLHQCNISAPCHHRTLHTFHLKNNNACISCQLSTTSLNAPPVPLSNGQSPPSMCPFSTSRWTKHMPTLGPHTRSCALNTTHPFPLLFLLYSHSLIACLYLSHHINTSHLALLKGIRQLKPIPLRSLSLM